MRLFLAAVAALCLVAAAAVVFPGPAWAQAVAAARDGPWWAPVLAVAVSGFFAVLAAVAASLMPMLRAYLQQEYKLAFVLRDEALSRKMDEGVINIIRAAEKEVQARFPAQPASDRGVVFNADVVKAAVPKVEKEFKTTILHFDKDRDAVKDFVVGRLDRALTPPKGPIGPVPAVAQDTQRTKADGGR